jgi:hypothetical protein
VPVHSNASDCRYLLLEYAEDLRQGEVGGGRVVDVAEVEQGTLRSPDAA